MSKVVGKVGITLAPPGKGVPKKYGVGGWGMAINADIDEKQKEAAWAFIKWLTSPAVHKEFNLRGAGSYLRISETHDPDLLAKYPFLPVIDETFEQRRRRIPPAHPAIPADPGHPRHRGECGAGRQYRSEEGARRGAGGGREAVLKSGGFRAWPLRKRIARSTSGRTSGPAASCSRLARLRYRRRRQLFLLILGAPALLYVLAGRHLAARPGHLPTASTTTACSARASTAFIGLDNYRELWTEPAARNSIVTTFTFTVAAVAVEFVLGLGLALLLWRDSLFQRVCLALLLIPVTVTPIVVGLVFRALLAADYGLFGYYLSALGPVEPARLPRRPGDGARHAGRRSTPGNGRRSWR